MLTPHPVLEKFERSCAARLESEMSLERALRMFDDFWSYARALGCTDTGDWREDVGPAIEIARVLNAPGTPGNA